MCQFHMIRNKKRSKNQEFKKWNCNTKLQIPENNNKSGFRVSTVIRV